MTGPRANFGDLQRGDSFRFVGGELICVKTSPGHYRLAHEPDNVLRLYQATDGIQVERLMRTEREV
jgi:hypothetical protein